MTNIENKDSTNRAAIIIRTADGILIGHTPNESRDKNGWDLPKGHIAIDEVPEEGAVRETKEETGLTIDPNNLVFLGKHRYQSGIIYLYGYDMPSFTYANLADLKCLSMFDWASYPDGSIIMKNTVWPKDAIKRQYPEITEFALVSPEELEQQLYYGLYHSLTPSAKKWINGENIESLSEEDLDTSFKSNHFDKSSSSKFDSGIFSFDDIIASEDDYKIVDDNDYYNELEDMDMAYHHALFDDDIDLFDQSAYDQYNDEWN